MSPSETRSQVDPLARASPDILGRPGADSRSLYAVTACLVIAAASWFLLREQSHCRDDIPSIGAILKMINARLKNFLKCEIIK